MDDVSRRSPASAAAAAPAPSPSSARNLRPLSVLWPFATRYRGRIALAGVALVAAAIATLVVPLAIRSMIDFGFSSDRAQFIDRYFAILVAVAAVLAISSATRFYLVTTIGERIVTDLRTAVFDHVTSLSASFFDKAMTGELISRLAADATQIKSAVGVSVSTALRNLILFIGSAIMMAVTSPRLSGFVLLAIPVIVLPLVAFGRMVRARSRNAQDTLADASAYAAELLGAVRTLQAYSNERLANSRFTSAMNAAYAAAVNSTLTRALLIAVTIFLVFASVVAVLWVGAQDVISGRISAGTLGQFVLYTVFAAGALSQISDVWAEVSHTAGAAERLAELLAIHPEIAAPAHPKPLPSPPRGDVAFEVVRFSYPTRAEIFVLDGVSFHASPGEKIAIVGPSGAGKSTIFHLLLRFYDPVSGAVTLDGVDMRETDPREARARIALVPQDSVMFASSIADNIRFGRPDASDSDVARAAELAAATEFIARLPTGMDTAIGERGVTLSGGQRQRLAIARAILRDAPILLLDEATSSLDAESESLVQEGLSRLMQGRTTLVIAHRLATVLKCDRILVMEHGRIVEQGTHDSLVADGGLYARLARLQFQTD
ncbi:MAG TPA: ABC transporter transmembrane domain-containing protein [Xanthobacteraceae bacterium]|nr:ABC transporter transmembrane domain-containing protein [Xanthobacteraceae bacterium]